MNLCPPGCLCLVHPLCIVWRKPGCPCMSVCLCPSHLISVATPCLECVHASVHEFMSTLHPMSGPPPIDSHMEVGCPCLSPLCFPSHLIFVPAPCLECVHASVNEFMSTWLLMSGPTSLSIVWWKPGCPCMAVCLCPSHLIFVPTPCLDMYKHQYMNLCLPYTPCLVHPLWIVTWKVWCPCYHCMCVPVTLFLLLHLV